MWRLCSSRGEDQYGNHDGDGQQNGGLVLNRHAKQRQRHEVGGGDADYRNDPIHPSSLFLGECGVNLTRHWWRAGKLC